MRGGSSHRHHILGVRHPTIDHRTFSKSGGSIGLGHTKGTGPIRFATPTNRARSSTNIPSGGHHRASGSTIPRLGKQLSVKDILHIKFPGKPRT